MIYQLLGLIYEKTGKFDRRTSKFTKIFCEYFPESSEAGRGSIFYRTNQKADERVGQ